MIQEFCFIVDCPKYEAVPSINERAKILVTNKHYLLDASAMWSIEDHTLMLVLRVSGSDQWKCSGYARQTAKLLLARHGLVKGEAPSPVRVTTEKNLRALTLDEGRTVRDYPDRATRMRRRRSSAAQQ